MKKIRKAVIPAAGYGVRLLPLSKVIPKELLPIWNKPAVQYVVEEAVAAGVEEIVLVLHPSKKIIADYFKPNSELNAFLAQRGKTKELRELEKIESLAKITVVYQQQPLGLGHAVFCSKNAIGKEPFLVLLPDVILQDDASSLKRLVSTCREKNTWGILLDRVPKEKFSSYGIVRGQSQQDATYHILGAVEKPSPENAPSNLSIVGRYLLTSDIFDAIERAEQNLLDEIQLTAAIDDLAKKQPGAGVLCHGKVFDIGIPERLAEAVEYFIREPSFDSSLEPSDPVLDKAFASSSGRA